VLAEDWTGRQVQAVHGPADLTWTEVAAVLSTATGVSIEAQRITDDEEGAALRDAGMGEAVVERIVGMGGHARRVHPGTAAFGADDDPEQPGRLGDHAPATGAVAAPHCTSFRR
jgi:hypothetical protein